MGTLSVLSAGYYRVSIAAVTSFHAVPICGDTAVLVAGFAWLRTMLCCRDGTISTEEMVRLLFCPELRRRDSSQTLTDNVSFPQVEL